MPDPHQMPIADMIGRSIEIDAADVAILLALASGALQAVAKMGRTPPPDLAACWTTAIARAEAALEAAVAPPRPQSN